MTAYIVTGLGFGDEGKGTIVDYLANKHEHDKPVVIRHCGGPQAAHNVCLPDGRHHTFSQFGSGTLVPGCKTHLSKFMFINPINMINEEQHLRSIDVLDAFERLSIAEGCPVITPFHVLTGRARENARSVDRHGSCGEGHGETVADYLKPYNVAGNWNVYAHDLNNEQTLREKLLYWRECKRIHIKEVDQPVPPEFDDIDLIDAIIEVYLWVGRHVRIVPDWEPTVLLANSTVIFEGSQGVLLDEWRGTHPHTTWSTTTDHNARSLIGTSKVNVRSIGVMRTYQTRHGAGPFPTEDRQCRIPEQHNNGSGFQGRWRRGHIDLVLTKYAIECCEQIDHLAVTHSDRYTTQMCTEYKDWGPIHPGRFMDLDYQQQFTDDLMEVKPAYRTFGLAQVTHHLGVPMWIASHGPTHLNKHEYDPMVGP